MKSSSAAHCSTRTSAHVPATPGRARPGGPAREFRRRTDVRSPCAVAHPAERVAVAAAAGIRGDVGAALLSPMAGWMILRTSRRPRCRPPAHGVEVGQAVVVAHVHAAVRRPGVPHGREVRGVVHGLAAREEHGVRHGRAVEPRDVVGVLDVDVEDALAGRRGRGTEAHVQGLQHLPVHHPAQRRGGLVDAQHSSGQAAGVESTRVCSAVVQLGIGRRRGHGVQPVERALVDRGHRDLALRPGSLGRRSWSRRRTPR